MLLLETVAWSCLVYQTMGMSLTASEGGDLSNVWRSLPPLFCEISVLSWSSFKYYLRLWRSSVWNGLLLYECFWHQKAVPQRSTTSTTRCTPSSACAHISGSSIFMTLDGADFQGYEKIMEEVHMLTFAKRLQSCVAHPSKSCCFTAASVWLGRFTLLWGHNTSLPGQAPQNHGLDWPGPRVIL